MTEYTRLIQDQSGNACCITLIDGSYNTDIDNSNNYINGTNNNIVYTNLYSISGERYILDHSLTSLTQMKNTVGDNSFNLYKLLDASYIIKSLPSNN